VVHGRIGSQHRARTRVAGLMDITEALRTTAAVRDFTGEPVDDATVAAILDDARFAPSGGNRQPWRVAVVRSQDTMQRFAEVTRPIWDAYMATGEQGRVPFNVIDGAPPEDHATGYPNPLLDAPERTGVVLAIAADLRRVAAVDADADRLPMAGGGSVFPFCWSILLSARSRGVGGVLTTFMSRAEQEVAGELGLPPEHALCALIYLGVPTRIVTRLRREPVAAFASHETFDGPTFGD